jgi:hypothetical protein
MFQSKVSVHFNSTFYFFERTEHLKITKFTGSVGGATMRLEDINKGHKEIPRSLIGQMGGKWWGNEWKLKEVKV